MLHQLSVRGSRPRSVAGAVRTACIRTSLLACLTLGCAGSDVPTAGKPAPLPASGKPTLQVSGELADTIGASFAVPLTAEVRRDARTPLRDALVEFAAVNGLTHDVVLGSDPSDRSLERVTVRTDGGGRAVVWARAWNRIGRYTVRVSVAGTGLLDSIALVVRPGRPAIVWLDGPRDTTLYVGRSFRAGAVDVRDRARNPVEARTTLTTSRPDVATVDSLGTVTARAIGRVFVRATTGAATDSIALSVVPRGELIASGRGPGLYVFQLDGSEYRRFSPEPQSGTTASPAWLPSGDAVIYQSAAPQPDGERSAERIARLDLGGIARPLTAPVGDYDAHLRPQVSADGQWVYYGYVRGYQRAELWRVHPDGTGAERIGPPAAAQGRVDAAPSPSPDGRRVVYWSAPDDIRILTLSTGQTVSTGLKGTYPRWSPTRDEVAYFGSEGLMIAPLAGGPPLVPWTGQHALRLGGLLNSTWRPDGDWLVLSIGSSELLGDRTVMLLERRTGEVLPLGYTRRDFLTDAAWRPAR